MKKFLQLSVFVAALAMSPVLHSIDEATQSFVNAVGSQPVACIGQDVQANMLKLQEMCADCSWSDLCRNLFEDLKDDCSVLMHKHAMQAVDECAAVCEKEMQKNVGCKQALAAICQDLKEYREFLASQESCLDVQSVMLAKGCKKRCCRRVTACCAPSVAVVPQGYFYATKQSEQGAALTDTFVAVPFSSVGVNDGNWVFNGTTNFTAQVAGTYLVTVSMAYNFAGTDATTDPSTLVLSPYLGGSALSTATVTYTESTTVVTAHSVIVNSNFIVSVAAGGVLTINNRQVALGATLGNYSHQTQGGTDPQWNNGSITIVRLS